MLCSITPDRALCSALNAVYFRLTFGRSAGTELDFSGRFSGSTRDIAALASLVATLPIPVSLADGKDLELELLLKNLRRAMSIDLQDTWTKSGRGTKLK